MVSDAMAGASSMNLLLTEFLCPHRCGALDWVPKTGFSKIDGVSVA
jgi:hypothetical protein